MDERMKRLADTLTLDHAEIKVMEEMAELQQVLCKYQLMAHGGFAKAPEVDFREKLVEELAHVKMWIDILQYDHEISDMEITQAQEKKIEFLCKMFDIRT